MSLATHMMMNKHIKIVAIAGAAIVALAIGLLVGFATKENDTMPRHYDYLSIIEGGSKSGKGSYEYYSGQKW
jgi:hypothetical protein